MSNTGARLTLGLMAVGLILTLLGRPIPVAAGFGLILALTLLTDRKAFRRVGKPRFWVFSLIVIALAGLWLGRNPREWHGIRYSLEGLEAGALMGARAFALILGFVAVSRQVSRDRFIDVTTRIGLPHYAPAFQEAMESLPRMRESIGKLRGQSRWFSLSGLADLLLTLKRMARDDPDAGAPMFAVTGAIGAGKTTWLNELAEQARTAGISVGGFVQNRVMNQAGETTGYDLRSIVSGETVWIARRKPERGFEFNPEAFARGAEWLERDKDCALLIVDELGLLEAKGEGHWPAVERALAARTAGINVVAARQDALAVFGERLGLAGVLDLDDAAADRGEFAAKVLAAVKPR